MPLKKGKANIGRNIKTEMAAGKPRKQAIAIAMNVAGKSKRDKKEKSFPPKKGKDGFTSNPMSGFRGNKTTMKRPSGRKR